ncbi:MAG TPA: ABC transporter permease subunit [Steroidobacteraceae bacterium]|nr:ABC transporter permease subunit [Steroidobacteraceae bacterium]
MNSIAIIFRRELASYFVTPLAYVVIFFFLVVANAFTFYFGGFYGSNQADLNTFFQWLPWLFAFFIPAISMRLWAEERSSGSIELLMTLPITLWQAAVGKFLAAWCFAGILLALTFPIWITVAWLGDPDNGAIFVGYLGALLMAGGFLAVGTCMSALTRNQVIAFVLGLVISLVSVLAALPIVRDGLSHILPAAIVDAIAGFSFLMRFQSISKGVLDLRDLLFFLMVMGFWLLATVIIIDIKKAE